MKTIQLKEVRIDHESFLYFYEKLKRDVNGNSRYKISVINQNDNELIYFNSTCYESQIESIIKNRLGYKED